MRVFTFTPLKYFGANTYILISGNEAAVIDPSTPFSDAESLIEEEGIDIKYIILTHAHFDHMLEIDSWTDNTSAEVIVGENEAYALTDSNANCYRRFFNKDIGYFGKYRTVKENDVLELGNESLRILDTPGHTSGSISLMTTDKVFVGDVVFDAGGVGRTDLPGGDYSLLVGSIKKISSLPPETVIYSGHGPVHTVKKLKRNITI